MIALSLSRAFRILQTNRLSVQYPNRVLHYTRPTLREASGPMQLYAAPEHRVAPLPEFRESARYGLLASHWCESASD
jgi:hypothetical protein